MLYELRHYTPRLIHLDVAVMCSDGAQGFAAAPASASAEAPPFFFVCFKTAQQLLRASRFEFDLHILSMADLLLLPAFVGAAEWTALFSHFGWNSKDSESESED